MSAMIVQGLSEHESDLAGVILELLRTNPDIFRVFIFGGIFGALLYGLTQRR